VRGIHNIAGTIHCRLRVHRSVTMSPLITVRAMTQPAIIEQSAADGVRLALTPTSQIGYIRGLREANNTGRENLIIIRFRFLETAVIS